jgi:hypothetical protein
MSGPINQIEMEIDGSFTLEQISDGLIEAEEMKNRNVTAMSVLPDTPQGKHLSKATLVKQPVGVPFPTLVLLKVPAGQLEAVKTAQKPKKFLFSATIWIENKQTEVAAFR